MATTTKPRQTCPNCGRERRPEYRLAFHPSNADEISEALELRRKAETARERSEWTRATKLQGKADRLARIHLHDRAWGAQYYNSAGEAVSNREPGVYYREAKETTGELATWYFDTFCRLKCAAEFGWRAHSAGFRRKDR